MEGYNNNSHPDLCTDLGAKRTSGHVPWLDIYARQSEFINQIEYMPIRSRASSSAPAKSRASSMAPARSRASTVTPGDLSDNAERSDGDFVLLRDPSKMQKHEIEACFTHWLARQEERKIGLEFSNVLNSRDGTLRPAARLEELSDLGETESDSPPPPPRNLPKRKRSKKQTKSGRRAVPQKGKAHKQRPPHLPDSLLPLDWDPVVDPILQQEQVPPQGQNANGAQSGLLTTMDSFGGHTGVNMSDSAHAGYLADIERGRMVMNGPVPAWMHNTLGNPLPDPPLRPAIRRGDMQGDTNAPNIGISTAADPMVGTHTPAAVAVASGGRAELHASEHRHEQREINPTNITVIAGGDPVPAGATIRSSPSPVPDCAARWMRTRSKSRSRNIEEPSTLAQIQEAGTSTMSEGIKRKRGTSNAQTSDGALCGGDLKKSKSTQGMMEHGMAAHTGERPKPRRRVGASGDTDLDLDNFDLRHRRVA